MARFTARDSGFRAACGKTATAFLLVAGSSGLTASSASAQPAAPKASVSATVTAPAVPAAPAGPAAGVRVAPATGASVAVPAAPAAPTAPTAGVAVPAGAVVTAPGAPVGSPVPPGSPTPASAAGGDKPMDGATYAVRLRDLEANVDELKDRIRRSHTRLALLSDTILSGGAAGSRAEISVDNEMSSAFRLTKALVVLDGAVQYNRADESGALADQKTIPILNGSVPPGDHTLQIVLTFQGNGYGVFSYLRSYHWDLKSSHSFTAVEGKTLNLTATALEKGGVTTPLDQRPAVEWKEKVTSLTPGAESAAAAAAQPAPTPAAAGTSK